MKICLNLIKTLWFGRIAELRLDSNVYLQLLIGLFNKDNWIYLIADVTR